MLKRSRVRRYPWKKVWTTRSFVAAVTPPPLSTNVSVRPFRLYTTVPGPLLGVGVPGGVVAVAVAGGRGVFVGVGVERGVDVAVGVAVKVGCGVVALETTRLSTFGPFGLSVARIFTEPAGRLAFCDLTVHVVQPVTGNDVVPMAAPFTLIDMGRSAVPPLA